MKRLAVCRDFKPFHPPPRTGSGGSFNGHPELWPEALDVFIADRFTGCGDAIELGLSRRGAPLSDELVTVKPRQSVQRQRQPGQKQSQQAQGYDNLGHQETSVFCIYVGHNLFSTYVIVMD
jgi:hypothetical protein